MDELKSWEQAVQEAKEAERIAQEVAEAIKQERESSQLSYRALAAQRRPLLQSYCQAVQVMSEKWERAWEAWDRSTKVYSSS